MEAETIRDRLKHSQVDLAGIRDYHQAYLDRRQGRGQSTETDTIMNEHQRQLDAAISLLKWVEKNVPLVFFGGYEPLSRVVHEFFGLGTVLYPSVSAWDTSICVKFDTRPSITTLDVRFAPLRPATREDEEAGEVQ